MIIFGEPKKWLKNWLQLFSTNFSINLEATKLFSHQQLLNVKKISLKQQTSRSYFFLQKKYLRGKKSNFHLFGKSP
jgi:hypothetical protein